MEASEPHLLAFQLHFKFSAGRCASVVACFGVRSRLGGLSNLDWVSKSFLISNLNAQNTWRNVAVLMF